MATTDRTAPDGSDGRGRPSREEGRKKKARSRRSVKQRGRMASTRRISIDIYVYTCIRARARALSGARRGATRTERLSTGSYFPVRQHGCRLSLVIAVPRATACVLPTRITPSSLARLSHFKRPLSLPRPVPPPPPPPSLPPSHLFSRFVPSFSVSSSSSSRDYPHRCVHCTRMFTPPARAYDAYLHPTSCSLSTCDEVKRDANGIDDN